jgi:hypothetical protein
VLNYTLFDLHDVVNTLQHAISSGEKIPALNWDDAGVHANKLLYFGDRKLVQYLTNLVDVIGVGLGGLIITTPSPNNLLRSLRGYEFYRIKIYRDKLAQRHATGYMSNLMPSGMRIIHREFTDYFNVLLPNEFWSEYVPKRKSYLSEALSNLSQFLDKPKQPIETLVS